MIIGQSVTRKDLKNTEELIEAVHRANTCCASMRFDLDLIENTDHKECLERKNRCHVIFDHMQGYYGVSSLESLSQGKPVIAGIDEWNEKWIEAFTGSENIPWIIAHNGIELKEKIIEIMDEEGRRIIGERSRNWMEKYWSDEIVTRRLIDYYCSLQS
jgi:glycosyltransferase involved in cell wall biosynthesis